MNVPKLYTPYDRPKEEYEVNIGPSLVEKVGYVPANILIENMIYAGERLDLARSDYYDFPDPDQVDYDFIDPTRSKNFDPADADYLMRSVEGRLSEQRKLFEKEELERKRYAEEEAKQFQLFKEEKAKVKKDE